jgi:hypothetical protein
MWPSTPPRAPTAGAPSTPPSALKRTWLDVRSRRTCARMAETAWALGADAGFQPYGLRRHAHGLGYGGHFLSKSQGYSTSFSALKTARAAWREAMRGGGHGGEKADRSLVRRLRAIGVGWANPGEARWAEFQQRQRSEERRLGNEEWYSRTEQDMERWGAW